MRTSIHVLSNQTLYAEALKSLLKEESQHFEVDAFTISSTLLKSGNSNQKPDIVLLDANGVGRSIWEFLKNIPNHSPNTRVIMLANSNEMVYREYAIKYGAMGYVLKSSPKELLTAAIKIVLKGGYFFDPGMQDVSTQPVDTGLKNKYNLSNREMEIIQLIKDGYSTKDVAGHLSLSFHTIESHRKNIYNKLNIRKVTELLKMYRDFELRQ